MSSLSKHERIDLEDVFLCLGKKESVSERVNEQRKRLFTCLNCIVTKGIPAGLSFVKSKKIIFRANRKGTKIKLFHYFIPKNRGSK